MNITTNPAVAHGMLDLAVHWLSPARIGATIVVHEQGFQWASMDVATKFHAPRLSITNRQHFPALFASLQQHDLATLVTSDGSVEYLGNPTVTERITGAGRVKRRDAADAHLQLAAAIPAR